MESKTLRSLRGGTVDEVHRSLHTLPSLRSQAMNRELEDMSTTSLAGMSVREWRSLVHDCNGCDTHNGVGAFFSAFLRPLRILDFILPGASEDLIFTHRILMCSLDMASFNYL